MTDRPIIFSAPMVRALLEGRKTQTRRILKLQPELNGAGLWVYPPYGQKITKRTWRGFCQTDAEGLASFILSTPHAPYAPGDRLWVCEDWRTVSSRGRDTPTQMRALALEAGWRRAWAPIRYEADGARDNWESGDDQGRRRWSRHMIREFSRLTLTVTDVRVQRLQEISEADAFAEGAMRWGADGPAGSIHQTARENFASLWNSLHGPDAWDANPWVVAISFTVARQNIDREAS